MTSSTTEGTKTGDDRVVYFGVININEDTKTIGAIDIWRSVITKDLFCEEKRLGILDIADSIGMPMIDNNKKWAVAISRKKVGSERWKLIKLIKEGKFKFTSADNQDCLVDVKDYTIRDSEWWSFLIEDNINRNIDTNNDRNAV
jgi:hypothetical protein